MTTRAHIGDVIRERRLARGLSLGQLATQLGETPAVVRSWERGEDRPDAEHTAALVAVLDLAAEELDDLLRPGTAAPSTEETAPKEAAPEKAGPEEAAPEHAAAEEAAPDDAAAEETEAGEPEAGAEPPDEEPPAEPDEPVVKRWPPAFSDEVSTVSAPADFTEASVTARSLTDAPTEAVEVPVGSVTRTGPWSGRGPAVAATEPGGVVVDRPVIEPITVPPLGLPNPLRALFDPRRRYLYWVRYVLTIVVLFLLARMFFWAAGELWTALGDFLDTFRATDSAEEEALRFLVVR